MKVGASGNEGCGDSASDELSAVVVEGLEIALELTFISLDEDGLPKLLKGHLPHFFKVFCGDVGATVGQSFTLPLRSQGDNVLSAVEFYHLHYSFTFLFVCARSHG